MAIRRLLLVGAALAAALWLLGASPSSAKKSTPSASRVERAVLLHLLCRRLDNLEQSSDGGLHYHGNLLGDAAYATLGAPSEIESPATGSTWSHAALLPVLARLSGHDPVVAVSFDAEGRVATRDYDPSSPFFVWLGSLVPRPQEQVCGRSAASYYPRYQTAMRTYGSAFVFLAERGAFADFSRDAYLAELQGESNQSKYTDHCDQFATQAGAGGNWLSSTDAVLIAQACHFWFRRSMDSTRPMLARLLAQRVLRPFDTVWWHAWGARMTRASRK